MTAFSLRVSCHVRNSSLIDSTEPVFGCQYAILPLGSIYYSYPYVILMILQRKRARYEQ
ncbi:hypothetical protein LIPSTDRAFT_72025 [Lipomyces starkeyi NRRL Y-11557]|uniref:Uncharacterized protein n=1 Tax=Lipomyces starkeyi NRRL Y-11557 TaxID=675824 RepID=A0A1E3Q626_LIPST|nr:hypothetical protein LIPSTDRAFT_72025 [Lipomyces starkeyi NRRL Y-11557]